ncbi:hypothetical protein COBT_003159, partial [Conglomerata obtusa]
MELKKRNMSLVSNRKYNKIKNNEVEEDDGDLKDFINKNNLIYFLNFYSNNSNFLINVQLGNKINFLALLDTGADVSSIYFKHIPENTRVQKISKTTKITCASGKQMLVLGICQLQIIINTHPYIFNVYVTSQPLSKITLGKNFIIKHKNVLFDKLKQNNVMSKEDNENDIHLIEKSEKEILRDHFFLRYKSMFKKNLTKNTF